MKCHNQPQIAALFPRSEKRRKKSNFIYSLMKHDHPPVQKPHLLQTAWPCLPTKKSTHIAAHTHMLTNLHERAHTDNLFRCLCVFCHEVVIQFVLPPSPWLCFLWVMLPQGVVNGSISENTKYRKQQRFQEMGKIQSEWMEGLRHHMF